MKILTEININKKKKHNIILNTLTKYKLETAKMYQSSNTKNNLSNKLILALFCKIFNSINRYKKQLTLSTVIEKIK